MFRYISSGERVSAKRFGDQLEFHVKGKGFTWKSDNPELDIRVAREAWEFAQQKMLSGNYDCIILDELTYLIKYKMVKEDEIISVLNNRPSALHVVVTGRDAPATLIEAADLVTDMRMVKHPLRDGIKAQRGVEF